jgi:hypothetical protein
MKLPPVFVFASRNGKDWHKGSDWDLHLLYWASVTGTFEAVKAQLESFINPSEVFRELHEFFGETEEFDCWVTLLWDGAPKVIKITQVGFINKTWDHTQFDGYCV